MIALAIVVLALATLPTVITFVNLMVMRIPSAAAGASVAILIPARNEEGGIAACVECALASEGVELEVIVLDDHSSDATAKVVVQLAAVDARVKLATAPPLPVGWSGKVHACHVLSRLTEAPNLIYVDADVRLAPDAAARLAGALEAADLVSGVPKQLMKTMPELMIIPMINMLLLGYLPIPLSRRDPRAALAAACGQLIAVRAEAYRNAGGHAGIRSSLHDGLALPRLFRRAGLKTDLVAASDLASCRMYTGWQAVIEGTTKNATEGMARPIALPVWSALLLGGHVLPWGVLAAALALEDRAAAGLAIAACAGPLTARLAQAIRCREPLRSVPLHPFAVVLLVALQWLALSRKWAGRPASWRGRSYSVKG